MTPKSPEPDSPSAKRARWFEPWLQDIRYALRGLLKTPGFTITVIVVLALGVGANAAMFSLVDRLFFREPSGIVDPASIVTASEVFKGGYMPGQDARAVAQFRQSVSGLATLALASSVYQGIDRATGPHIFAISDNYFSMLGVRMARGRTFTEDEVADSLAVAIVSYRYWQRSLDGDTTVLGRSVELAGKRYTVVGVVARDFTGTGIEATDIWLPLSPADAGGMLLRLRPGVTRERVEAAMTVALHQMLRPNSRRGYVPPTIKTNALVLGQQSLGGAPNPRFMIIVRVAGVAGIILLVAIANVATLLLMRATRRRREVAVRLALGISRGRLVRQLVVEGVLLSIIAGAAAIVAGVWGGAVTRAEFMSLYRLSYPLLDWRFIGFTLGVAVAAGLVAGLVPALHASRPDLTRDLKAAGRGRYRRSWFRSGLVVAQAALSVVLVVGAALFVRSLTNIHNVPLGIDVGQLMFAQANFAQRDSVAAYIPLVEQEAERVRGITGVEGVAVSAMAPMGGVMGGLFLRPNGDTLQLADNGKRMGIGGNLVSPGYFQTVGMRLLQGRDFTSADARGGPPVVIVSEKMAQLTWPGRHAVGQCLKWFATTAPCAQVVGVVSDANLWSIKPEPTVSFYFPIAQHRPPGAVNLVIRADADTRKAISPTVRRELGAMFPATTSLRVEDVQNALSPQYAQWNEGAAVFSAMAILALIVSAIGMYSIIGYAVSERMHEMGVRVALGARRGQVMRPVLLGGIKLAVMGVVIGIAASLAMGRLVASLLYDTSARDLASMIGAAVILLVAGILASLVPARRAARVDPMEALRAE